MMYEVIVIWDDGSKNMYPFKTVEEAEQCETNFKKAFGNQVSWTGIVKHL